MSGYEEYVSRSAADSSEKVPGTTLFHRCRFSDHYSLPGQTSLALLYQPDHSVEFLQVLKVAIQQFGL